MQLFKSCPSDAPNQISFPVIKQRPINYFLLMLNILAMSNGRCVCGCVCVFWGVLNVILSPLSDRSLLSCAFKSVISLSDYLCLVLLIMLVYFVYLNQFNLNDFLILTCNTKQNLCILTAKKHVSSKRADL